MNIGVQAWLDQEDAHVVAMVRKYGWFIQYVDSEKGPPFAYTVGLFGLHHPELLILGVPPDTASAVLNDLGTRVKAGDNLLPGQLITFAQWPHRIVPEQVPNPNEIVFGANRYYGLGDAYSVPVLQLSYDDTEGRFPWESDYIAPEMQPRPGTFGGG